MAKNEATVADQNLEQKVVQVQPAESSSSGF